MQNRNKRFLILISILIFLIFVNLALSQYDTKKDKNKTNNSIFLSEKQNDSTISDVETDGFYKVPESSWPKITYFKSISAVVCYIALFFGFAIFVIGTFSGARLNKSKVRAAIIIGVVIGIFSRSIFIRLQTYLYLLLIRKPLTMNAMLASSLVDLVFFIGGLFYVAGIAVYMYETFTVTAKEVFTPKA